MLRILAFNNHSPILVYLFLYSYNLFQTCWAGLGWVGIGSVFLLLFLFHHLVASKTSFPYFGTFCLYCLTVCWCLSNPPAFSKFTSFLLEQFLILLLYFAFQLTVYLVFVLIFTIFLSWYKFPICCSSLLSYFGFVSMLLMEWQRLSLLSCDDIQFVDFISFFIQSLLYSYLLYFSFKFFT